MPTPISFLPATGLHHVALKTRDWDRSTAFYRDVLGFTLKISWTMPNGLRAAMFDMGGSQYLEMFEDPAYTPSPDGALLHLALRTNEVDAATARVRAAGMRITIEPKDVVFDTTNGFGEVHIRLSFFIGPNGETWEFFQNERT
jgi:glyoxylase I family protein